MDKAKLFFEYVDSLTLKDNFMKDKDMEMTDEEIHNIMELAEFICN